MSGEVDPLGGVPDAVVGAMTTQRDRLTAALKAASLPGEEREFVDALLAHGVRVADVGCPKCGHDNIEVEYCFHRHKHLPWLREFLLKSCNQCGFKWRAPTVDSEPWFDGITVVPVR